MNSKTHKIITSTTDTLYAVPIDWEVKDIKIKYGNLFYKQEEQYDVPNEEREPDDKYHNQIEDFGGNLEDYFSCEEEEEDDWHTEEEEEKPICCVGCGQKGIFPENRDGDTMCVSCHSDGEEEEEEERYCDNEKCPYEGYCFGEVKEQFEGKPYICEGCVNGKGLQEEEEGFTQQTFEALSAAIVSEEEKDSARVFLFGKQEEAEDKGERIKSLANLPYYKRVRL